MPRFLGTLMAETVLSVYPQEPEQHLASRGCYILTVEGMEYPARLSLGFPPTGSGVLSPTTTPLNLLDRVHWRASQIFFYYSHKESKNPQNLEMLDV